MVNKGYWNCFLWFIALYLIIEDSSANETKIDGLLENKYLKSGAIFIIDRKTIFMTNLKWNQHKDIQPENLYFQGHTKDGHILMLEYTDISGYILDAQLRSFIGEDMILQIPNDRTIMDLDRMLVASLTGDFQIVALEFMGMNKSEIPIADGYHEYTKEGNYQARYPKCCEYSMDPALQQCGDHLIVPDEHLKIYKGNNTFMDDESLKNVTYKPYLQRPYCSIMYPLQPSSDSFYYLSDGILLYMGQIWTKGNFCIDIHQIDGVNYETPYMCFTDEDLDRETPQIINVIYICGIFISALGLIITCGIFIFVESARECRGYNVIGYTLSTAAAFVCLASARLLHVDGETCQYIGYLYQFLLVCSFTWLCWLIIDTYWRVLYAVGSRKTLPHWRNTVYLLAAMAIPLITVIVSYLINDLVPSYFSLSRSIHEACWFRSDKKLFFYYVPIVFSILVNIIVLLLTRCQLHKNRHQDTNIKLWERANNYSVKLTNVNRSNFYLILIMFICWSAEIISFSLRSNNAFSLFVDIITTIQGVFVLVIFIYHEPVYSVMKKRFCSAKVGNECPQNYEMVGQSEG